MEQILPEPDWRCPARCCSAPPPGTRAHRGGARVIKAMHGTLRTHVTFRSRVLLLEGCLYLQQ
jgi:hypothetical protein